MAKTVTKTSATFRQVVGHKRGTQVEAGSRADISDLINTTYGGDREDLNPEAVRHPEQDQAARGQAGGG